MLGTLLECVNADCSVRISALALLKMAMHAKSGGNLEIMGMLYGKVQGDPFIVIDAPSPLLHVIKWLRVSSAATSRLWAAHHADAEQHLKGWLLPRICLQSKSPASTDPP